MRIYIVAGEPSGDLLAAGLMAALRGLDPDVEFRGVGGEEMAAQGLQSRFDMADISVMGVFEVLPRLRTILAHERRTVRDILDWRPDALVTVDSWGFVSRLLGSLRKQGASMPMVHYVAPQVWAWKRGRAPGVARLVDRLMTLLPYEGKYFEKYGLRCDFVGHPVVERMSGLKLDPAGLRESLGIGAGQKVVCVLPGSRRGELKRLLPVFRRAMEMLLERCGETCFVVPTLANLEGRVHEAFDGLPVKVLSDTSRKYDAFAAADAAIAASGTVSLELAAVGTPHLVAYRFSPLTDVLVRMVIRTPFANLINILAGREVIPEFMLANCRPAPIARCAGELLSSPDGAARMAEQASEILATLRPAEMTPSERAARIVFEEAARSAGG